MAENSKIQWTDHTWNPWHGCKKVSPGCKYCYMYRDKERYGQDPTKVIRSKTGFNTPLMWQGVIKRKGFSFREGITFPGMKIFTCSWSDFFIEEADPWREDAWDIIRRTPEFTYQILTKRPERIAQCLPQDWGPYGYPNVWMGVSIENQVRMNRLFILQSIKTTFSSFKTFVSAEPLIGYLYLGNNGLLKSSFIDSLDWIIIGGESGNNKGKYLYRECRIDWIERLILDCKEYQIPVFVKQLGTHLSKELGLKDRHGGDISEWPEHLQIREFPQQKVLDHG